MTLVCVLCFSGSTVNVVITLEREDEVSGPVIAPFFPQVSSVLGFVYVAFVGRYEGCVCICL